MARYIGLDAHATTCTLAWVGTSGRRLTKARSLTMTQLAEDADLGRQALYRSLSKDGNPELQTLTNVLRELGLRLAVESAA